MIVYANCWLHREVKLEFPSIINGVIDYMIT